MPLIRLALLTYNEAESIPKVAESVLPYIHSWVVLNDTRSSDGTEDICYQQFGHLPGKVVNSDFIDFATARNQLLDLARDGFYGYILMLDPDSPITGVIDRKSLSIPIYSAKTVDEATQTEYLTHILFHSKAVCHYEGAVHEGLFTTEQTAIVPDFTIHRLGCGASKERIEWSISVLQKTPDDPRSVFYLAQSLRDLGKYPDAAHAYIRRAGMIGFDQETFYAMFQAGICLELAGEYFHAIQWYAKAIGYRPQRLEPYFYLRDVLDRVSKQLQPSTDLLFVNRWIEQQVLDTPLTNENHRVPDEVANLSPWKLVLQRDGIKSDPEQVSEENRQRVNV